ncbi:hypothetical protein KIW84_035419 [Lathyrus oleraceus]|uniref:Uncharacterized protein n=1 Tax=Pisum sativum TaxID=3888 RepID=A0A9D5B0P9_PEA|nr:hypothetical protein KIW84_035419 [Pisum sativum]
MLMHLLPSINKVFSLLIQHERQQQQLNNDDIKLVANFNKPTFSGKYFDQNPKSNYTGHGRGHKVCSYCNKIGHYHRILFQETQSPSLLEETDYSSYFQQ